MFMGLTGVRGAPDFCLAQSLPGGFFEPEKRPQDQVFPIKIERIGFRLLALDCFPQAGKLRKGTRPLQPLRYFGFRAQCAFSRRSVGNNPGDALAGKFKEQLIGAVRP